MAGTVLQMEPILEWLLEEENPSVRYFALQDLLGKLPDDPEVVAARHAIMQQGVVPAILAEQNADGSWGDPRRFYTDKYRGSVWQLLVLAEMGADPSDPRVRNACAFILDAAQDRESGGFSVGHAVKLGGGRHSEVIPCLTGNMVWSLLRLGFADDDRVTRGIDWICRYQRFDDGDGAPVGWPYDKYEICWGKHTCHMGVVKALKALSAIAPAKRSETCQKTLHDGTKYLLAHRIYQKSHQLGVVSKPGWLHLGFPLMYQTDILEILGILTDLGCRDARMGEALAVVRAKCGADGAWKMENSFNGKMRVDVEVNGERSKWLTLKALRVLTAV